MPCYRPVTVWKPDSGGSVAFRELPNHREINIPCGKCIGCRIQIRDAWAFRCYAESRMHSRSVFVTLTYDDEHLPKDQSLDHRHWQLFAKRLRERIGKFRFFMCGEYGENTARPHYHALLFGVDFADRMQWSSIYAKNVLWRSDLLDEVWGAGRCTFGEVTYASARYCATYVTKRLSDDVWAEQGRMIDVSSGETWVRKQPYGKMSLKPGIGASWFEKYYPEVVTHGGVFVNDRKSGIPRYFDDLLERIAPDDFEASKLSRQEVALKYIHNCTRERLEVREACAHAKKRFDSERYPNAL